MPKIIVTSRYLKNNKNINNYVKYIATREGAVKVSNAMENYIGYLANRPGAVKYSSHALFSQEDKPINLNEVAKEIANHRGNVWTHVVSLRRDNAQAMGYDNLTAWRELVKRQIPNIAKNQKINMANLKWYAAFHDKKTNPHVHIIVYSTNEREGFLTNQGIEKIRSGFANDIYTDELHHLYARQTELRNLLKKESEQLMIQLSERVSHSNYFDTELINNVAKLHTQLINSKGKKVYGYLKPDVKKTVDEVFSLLADNETIKKMYSIWCEMEQQKHDVYSSTRVDFPPLVLNPNFKSIKNMIIHTVMLIDNYTEAIGIDAFQPLEQTDNHISDLYYDSNEVVQETDVNNYLKDKVLTKNNENAIITKTILSLFVNLSKCIEENTLQEYRSYELTVDRKLTRIIKNKKQSLGANEYIDHS